MDNVPKRTKDSFGDCLLKMLFICRTNMNQFYSNNDGKFDRVSKTNPCVHCGKPDWCYRLGELSVCPRVTEGTATIAENWEQTSQQDDNGHYYLAPITEKKVINPKGTIVYHYPDRQGNELIKITRIDDGNGKKDFKQEHYDGNCWHEHLNNCNPSDVPIYRYQDVRDAIARKEQYIFLVEGEKAVNKLWELGLPATTIRPGKFREEHVKDLEGAKRVVLCPDRDIPGINKMTKVSDFLVSYNVPIAWLFAPPSDFFWQKLPKNNGLDIYDWIVRDKATAEQIIAAITYEPLELDKTEAPRIEETEDNFTQKAYAALYGERSYISINQHLYKWNGSHYERVSEFEEKKRIALWCQSTPLPKRGGGYRYGLATTSKVEEIYKWAMVINAVDPSKINPPGINCKNGVVVINWLGKVPHIELKPHDPKRYFTYCSDVEYNQDADPTMCDRLLAALDKPQRDIFLKIIAASLDLKTVRKYYSGDIKALLLQGTGSNGKDSLWQSVAAILRDSMTQISLSDFQEYDKGRKFNVARLATSRICWASENSSYVSLDNLQILKQAVTSEEIVIEEKNLPAYEVEVNSVFLFNVNEAPLINAGLEAIKRRYAVLSFNKTYCKDAKPELNQLEADPRFRYDPEFLNNEIAPSLLNYILAALKSLVTEGIDYSCTEDALETIKKQSNHLWEFVEDIGLVPDPNGQVYVQDIWEQLKQWYMDNDILERQDGKNYWQPPIRKGDDYVKASRLLYSKLKDIFPQIDKKTSTTGDIKNKAVIMGIRLIRSVRQTVRLKALENMTVRQSEANTLYYSEIEFIKLYLKKLTRFQALEVQEYIKNLLSQQESENSQQTSENSSDSELGNLPNFASPPPPLWVAA